MPGIRRPLTVTARDERGTVRQVPLALWRAEDLPRALRCFWTEPEELARLIECAIDAGAFADVLEAAEQLSRIDPDRERRYCLPAIVYAAVGQFSRAEELLERRESLYGASWHGLLARAEVALSGNRKAKGVELLRAALELEPDASRPLRRLVEELSGGDTETVLKSVEEIAAVRGSWRARLWLAAHGTRDVRHFEMLVRSAVEESRDEPDVLTVASSVIASKGLGRMLVDFVAPRYRLDREGVECGVNLLFGFLSAGRKVPGEALLQRLAPRLEESGLREYADFYRAAFRNLREPQKDESAREPNAALLRAMATAVRQATAGARRRMWSLLAGAELLAPIARPWIEVPLFDSPWPSMPHALEIVTGVDSEGREVAIAFTDERTLRAWGPLRSPAVRMTTRALLEIVAEEKECSIVVNPAGPTATELALPDIEAFLDGRAPAGEDSSIRFLAEPLRRDVPDGFTKAASSFLRGSGIVRDAWLFEMVDDRSGVNPAIAVEFAAECDPGARRELLIDGADEVRWDDRRSRRVRFLALSEGRLADYLRVIGLRIDLA